MFVYDRQVLEQCFNQSCRTCAYDFACARSVKKLKHNEMIVVVVVVLGFYVPPTAKVIRTRDPG